MSRIVSRRGVVLGSGLVAAASVLPRGLSAENLVVTPGQTEGPFYPADFPADKDTDLVKVQGEAARALGTVAHVSGRVLDRNGRPVGGARVEIWQCDANGRYRHPYAPETERFDVGFQGYGRTEVNALGSYAFRTIRPVAYPGRTPHIHFAVQAPGAGRLTTQLYVEGDPLNERDGILRRIRNARQRRNVIVPFVPADDLEAGSLAARFDIVLDV